MTHKLKVFLMQFSGGTIALSIGELAKAGPFGRSTIYEALNSGSLRAKKLNDRTVIPLWRAVEWVESLPEYPTDSALTLEGVRDRRKGRYGKKLGEVAPAGDEQGD